MKGKENPTNEYDTLEIVEVTPRAQVNTHQITPCLPVANWVRVTPALKPLSFSGHP